MIDLSIVMVSYNARADLERCLRSLQEHPPALMHEIIVVDNASVDDSVAVARARGVQVIEAGSNRGFSAANNIGIRASRGRLLLLLNSDTIVPPHAIDRLAAALETDPEVGVAGPRLVDGHGRAEWSFGEMLGPLVEWRRRQVMKKLARGDQDTIAAIEALTRREQSPDWVTGACLMVRRTDAEAVGLLDERFTLYTEDVDFCAAIRARGHRILFVPSVEVVHLRGRSVAVTPSTTRAMYRRSHLAFYWKHHPLIYPLLWLYHALGR